MNRTLVSEEKTFLWEEKGNFFFYFEFLAAGCDILKGTYKNLRTFNFFEV